MNCFNMKCPNCGDSNQIDVEAIIWTRLTEDGSDVDEADEKGTEWFKDSRARCGECGHEETVSAFECAEVTANGAEGA